MFYYSSKPHAVCFKEYFKFFNFWCYLLRIAGCSERENFHEFHESSLIYENFTLEMFTFQ